MDTVVDVVPAGETMIAVKADPTAPVDLLGRQEIIDRIMKILEVISEKKSSCTFALNGAWGTGKTFVLNMLMNQLWEYHSNKYIVFHYNCWQYDYYEEPLIAIVAAMLDSVDEENHLLPEKLRDKAKAGMELAKPVLKKIATDFVKNKIGVDLTDVVSSVKDYQEALDAEEQKKAESRSFDEFYSFKKAIQQAQEEIRKLAEDRTLVVVVDELDRCLPNYAIKVLERLHHLFAGISNSAVLIAVDKNQLDQTISVTFGGNTNTTKYLRKFINYEFELGNGYMNSGFWGKYSDYFSMFDKSLIQTDFPYEQFVSALFSGVDIRTQERLMERVTTAHHMLFPNTKKDYSFMCCELMYIVFTEIYEFQGNYPLYYKESYDEDGKPGFKLGLKPSKEPFNAIMISFIDRYWSNDFIKVTERYSNHCLMLHLSGDGIIQRLLIQYLKLLPIALAEDPVFSIDFTNYPRDQFNQNLSDLRIACNLISILK
ncbi:MAG: hypothetical protein IJX04_00055 [Oscillospiraceae bacterium]|nr:hypothetical protein [Oscillospiraceae bacterium]